jgi:hypothetical protein
LNEPHEELRRKIAQRFQIERWFSNGLRDERSESLNSSPVKPEQLTRAARVNLDVELTDRLKPRTEWVGARWAHSLC